MKFAEKLGNIDKYPELWDGYDCDNGCFEGASDDWGGTEFTLRNLRVSVSWLSAEQREADEALYGEWWNEYKSTLPEKKSLSGWEIKHTTNEEWLGLFTDDQVTGRLIPPGTWTHLVRRDGDDGAATKWMADTPAETLGHLEFIWSAHGSVLINGLGMGVVIENILRKDCVTTVDVVEIDADLAKFITGMEPIKSFVKAGRVKVHIGDAYTMKWPTGKKWNVVFSDIWPTINEENLVGMEKLQRKYAQRSNLHFFWERNLCRAMRDGAGYQ